LVADPVPAQYVMLSTWVENTMYSLRKQGVPPLLSVVDFVRKAKQFGVPQSGAAAALRVAL